MNNLDLKQIGTCSQLYELLLDIVTVIVREKLESDLTFEYQSFKKTFQLVPITTVVHKLQLASAYEHINVSHLSLLKDQITCLSEVPMLESKVWINLTHHQPIHPSVSYAFRDLD